MGRFALTNKIFPYLKVLNVNWPSEITKDRYLILYDNNDHFHNHHFNNYHIMIIMIIMMMMMAIVMGLGDLENKCGDQMNMTMVGL